MSYENFVLIGTGAESAPHHDIYDIPRVEAEPDGLHATLPECPECSKHHGYAPPHICPRVSPTCPDCRRGQLLWAEAGYVPRHRICDCCGSHFSLTLSWPDGYIARAVFQRQA